VTALVSNISEDEALLEPTKLAITSFSNSLRFATHNFENEQQRNLIMEKILKSGESTNETIQEQALYCLREVAIYHYKYLGLYFELICKATGLAARSTSDKVGA
jgi:hypothetical protein